jgi:glucose/arabinose dehydrogenase
MKIAHRQKNSTSPLFQPVPGSAYAPLMHKPLLATVAAAALLGLATQPQQPLPLNQIKLPPGFTIDLYATGVPHAREMVLGAKGTLFVGSRDHDKVYAIVDRDNDHKADRVYTIAEGLKDPSGVAFRNGALYIAEVSRIIRYDSIEATLEKPPAPAVVKGDLPTETHHGQKFIRFGPDGLLYVPVGAHEAGWQRDRDLCQRRAQHRRLRLASSDARVVVHR